MNAGLFPMFPLRLVVYPGQALNLHIFEPRYKQLMQDCLSGEVTLFGIPPFLHGGLSAYGTLVQLEEVSNVHPDGELDVKTRGVQRFKLQRFQQFMEGKMYPCAEVELFEDELPGEDPLLRDTVWKRYLEFFQVMNFGHPARVLPDQPLSFQVAGKAGLNIDQEINLLQLTGENARLLLLEEHFNTLLPIVAEMEQLRERVKLNGHFRKLNSPDF